MQKLLYLHTNTKFVKEEKLKKKETTIKKSKASLIWLLAVAFIAVSLLLFCQFYFGDSISSKTTFYQNTHINGIDVSGLTKKEANNILLNSLSDNKESLNITLKSQESSWSITGKELGFIGNLEPTLNEVINYGHEGNIFTKKKIENNIKKNGLYVSVPFEDVYSGIEEKIESIINEIEAQPKSSGIQFDPNSAVMFSQTKAVPGKIVNRDALFGQIAKILSGGGENEIEIPIVEILPDENLDTLLNNIKLRSSFSTNYSTSSADRKSNVKLALSKFNGMIIEPNEEISFNKITGTRNKDNGYKTAKIIIGGKYVDGVGGGVCQASTTLYNALILSDIEILQVNHHTLPASYVPLSFDAMVSEGYADLKFKNNLDTPIFIKTICDEQTATVEIYGQPFEEGLTVQTRAELVKILPHGGDDIITDYKGEYENKVLYRGEYYRLKYPQEGYESKGFIEYVKEGKVISSKEIRHDKYLPQNGIIVEGSSSLEEGMSLPSNSVRYISPQKVTKENEKNAKSKWNLV